METFAIAMRQLLGEDRLEDGSLRQLFLQCLATNAQLILASTADNVPLEELAVLAGQILEVTPSQPSIAAISNPMVVSSAAKEIDALHNQVDGLANQLITLINQLRKHPRSRSRLPGTSPAHFRPQRDSSTSSQNERHPYCR